MITLTEFKNEKRTVRINKILHEYFVFIKTAKGYHRNYHYRGYLRAKSKFNRACKGEK